jgi:hypothetical protein
LSVFKAILFTVNYVFLIKVLFNNFIKQFSLGLEIIMLISSGKKTGYGIAFTANERSLLYTRKVRG